MNDIKDFHKELLFLLKELDAICSKQNIKYSLFAGTLIGAIRHKGFIPWDDDADVVFERSEYDKFISVLPSHFSIVNSLWVTQFVSNDNPKNYIDVFVFDATSNSKILRNLQVFGLKAIQGTLKTQITKDKGVFGMISTGILSTIGFAFSKKFKLKVYNKLAKIFKSKKSDCMFSSLDQYKYIGNILPQSVLNSYSKVSFEDTELMIMDGYDLYLKKFYGDYMKLPPVEDQKPEHGNVK